MFQVQYRWFKGTVVKDARRKQTVQILPWLNEPEQYFSWAGIWNYAY